MNRKGDTHHKLEASPAASQTTSSPVLVGRQRMSSEVRARTSCIRSHGCVSDQ